MHAPDGRQEGREEPSRWRSIALVRARLERDLADRPVQRAVRLALGLVLFGVALSLLVRADLGLDPWDVLAQGIAKQVGLSIGTVTVLVSLLLLLVWIPLRQRPGVGTLANAIVVGVVLDLALRVVPAPQPGAPQALYLVLAVVGAAVASGLYIGAGWGPGARDGLMTGLAARGVPLVIARAGIELTVLVSGWLLGGSVGIGTVVFALLIGPLVAWFLPRLSIRAREAGAS